VVGTISIDTVGAVSIGTVGTSRCIFDRCGGYNFDR
jgi:hypothetical protein